MNPAATPTDPQAQGLTPFVHKVGAPLMWLAIGYLAATIIQRPRRAPHA